MISIIIPVFNEEKIIRDTLKQFSNLANIEVIVVDGNSKDKTNKIVQEISEQKPQIRLVTAPKLGRANQMNYGASIAKGEIILFLHADTILPQNYQQVILKILKQQKVILGAFQLEINGKEASLRIIETMVNFRSKILALPYGDQGFFITKEQFNNLDGFLDLPIMEDFEFVQRVKNQGKIAIAEAQVVTSARRWQKLGVVKTTIINQLIIIGYYLKINPIKLRNFYRNVTPK